MFGWTMYKTCSCMTNWNILFYTSSFKFNKRYEDKVLCFCLSVEGSVTVNNVKQPTWSFNYKSTLTLATVTSQLITVWASVSSKISNAMWWNKWKTFPLMDRILLKEFHILSTENVTSSDTSNGLKACCYNTSPAQLQPPFSALCAH